MLRAVLVFLSLGGSASAHGTLEKVKAAGQLRCGVIAEQSDFDWRDTHGDVSRFGMDMCRAVALAVFGDAAALRVHGYPDSPHALQALRDGALDVVYGVTPRPEWTIRYGVDFAQPVFFDGQGFLVAAADRIAGLSGLADKAVCFIGGTATEAAARQAFARRNIAFRPFPFQETGEMQAALVTGHCKAETADVSSLAAGRTAFHGRQADFAILPETVTLDPFAPAVPADDTAWRHVVDATFFTLVQAEIDGVTQAKASQGASGLDGLPEAAGSGAALGLPDGWQKKLVAGEGNYGEVFARDLGALSPLRLPTGVNRPWTEGGLLWALGGSR